MVLTHLIFFNFFHGASSGEAPPPVVVTDQGGGVANWDAFERGAPRRRRKKKTDSVVIRFSDFESQEAYAAALAAATIPMSAVREDGTIDPEYEDDLDDDEIIKVVILRLLS